MADAVVTPEVIEALARKVEARLGERLPVTLWMLLLSFTEDYLLARGMLTASRWASGAAELGVETADFRAAFDDADAGT
jgi:hypothetical protein